MCFSSQSEGKLVQNASIMQMRQKLIHLQFIVTELKPQFSSSTYPTFVEKLNTVYMRKQFKNYLF